MAMTERSTVVGVFEDRAAAERAVEELEREGFREDQIGFARREDGGSDVGEEVHAEHYHSPAPPSGETGTRSEEEGAKGALAGGVVGGLLGAAASLLIPGIGPIAAAGVLGTALAGAAVGAGAGGIAGVLRGAGIPEEQARYYEGEVRSGRTLVTVRADGRQREAEAILRRHGAHDVDAGGTRPVGVGLADRRPDLDVGERSVRGARDEGETLALREEDLHARKERVEAGTVQLRKEIVTEERTLDVPVMREEVIVERRSVDARPSDRPIGEDEPIEIPVRQEEVTIEKQPVVYEEIGVGKREIEETERLSDTVRREVAQIETEGQVDVEGDAATRRPGSPRQRPENR